MSEIFIYDTKYEGEDAKSKIARVRSQMLERGVDVLKTFVPEEAAWLLNLRGAGAGEEYADDLKKFTPVFLCELEMTEDSIILYVNQEISEEVSGYLNDLGVSVEQKDLEERDINIEEDKTLISDLMMIKNDVQIKNMKDVFFDDGLVWMKFIRWIKDEAKSGSLTEIDVKKKMEELRREVADYVMPSFETIPAYNESAADIHYHVTEESNKVIKPEGLIMVDTGGQYLRGTTDTTRTIALGPVTDKMKEMYTAVLKGHIDVALAKVEEGTTGDVLDDIARKYIREKGLDYEEEVLPVIHDRIDHSRNLILILTSYTKESEIMNEETDYAINVKRLPVVVVYPELSKEEILNSDGSISEKRIHQCDRCC